MEGKKADLGKLRWTLLPWVALQEVVKVLEYGAKKYEANNWKKVKPIERYDEALIRHVASWRMGELRDPETGLLHVAHIACNALFIIYFSLKKTSHGSDKE